ncbi:hypothetical protein BC937DRAFT_94109 [Endogone sp. FLAS-F59071]|nr:hypothetical protein BC937DRAFT_94109 [Endogone sp. FLAS-F59071]|eukprot:RUS22990.1 hypothetical protein BC937DRAFT_94109 [Endogone sp. FLAS-F59071]
MPPTKPIIDVLRQLVPPLSHEFHKGQAGRVGVVGGSEDYTGAPFFSGISAMRLGADLCHIFCEPDAATVIKVSLFCPIGTSLTAEILYHQSYSPDLIVHPYLRKTKYAVSYALLLPTTTVFIVFSHPYPKSCSKGKTPDLTVDEIISSVESLFPRLHVLIVGPGLSRDSHMLECAKGVINKAREQGMPIVLDAHSMSAHRNDYLCFPQDALFLVQNHPEVIQNYHRAVLTPNINEFKKLCERMLIAPMQSISFESNHKDDMALRLSQALGGVTIVQKGNQDLISNGDQIFVCDIEGGLKRMGGQGDILSGLIATFLAWGKAYEENVWKHAANIKSTDIPVLAGYAGCHLVREVARSAYAKHGRAVLTSDMVGEIGGAFSRMFGESE